MSNFRPCAECPVINSDMNTVEEKVASQCVGLLERAIFLDILELVHTRNELTAQQASAITACQEARRDNICTYSRY